MNSKKVHIEGIPSICAVPTVNSKLHKLASGNTSTGPFIVTQWLIILLTLKCLSSIATGSYDMIQPTGAYARKDYGQIGPRLDQYLFAITPLSLLVTSDKGGGKCVCPRSFVCLSVCLSVTKITQKRVDGFG